ncbi:MAG: metallophosphoesterase, partial [Deltaproteobacteria bacterium]|nr:metallophosphoesterase [Deltaproteobacteria bacterium]
GASVILWIIFYLGRVVGHGGTGLLAVILEFLGMTWMAVLFLTFIPMLALDILTVFGFLMPRLSSSLRGWALVLGGLLSLIALFQGLRPPVVRNYEVQLRGLPDNLHGTVIIALSDLHLGSQIGERWLKRRVSQVMALKPDLVVLLGDIFEGHGPSEKGLIKTLRRISSPIGVWAVAGNHEFHGQRRGISMMEEANFQVLRNHWAEIRPGLILAGVDDLTSGRRAKQESDPVMQALAGRPPGATVLLSHTPWQTEKASKAGVGLMLSGHTHGGQIWPFGYLVKQKYPLLAGKHEIGDMTVIVSRGTGTWGPRMRLWHPGEILRVTLKNKG